MARFSKRGCEFPLLRQFRQICFGERNKSTPRLVNLNVATQPFAPTSPLPSLPFVDPFAFERRFELGPNDSPIQRGDREDTGDNEARPDEMGSGDAQPTADPTSFGGTTSIGHRESDRFDPADELLDVDGMETMLPTDARLGLTNVGDVPADDWAADTGPTRTGEEQDDR